MTVRIGSTAKRQIRALPEPWPDRILNAIVSLEYEHKPYNAQELRGHDKYFRLKMPPYRILYRVGQGHVYVFRVEERTEKTYRGFNPSA